MTAAPFTLPAATRASLDTIFPRGMTVPEVARTSPERGFTIAGMTEQHLVMRHDSRAYVRLALAPDRTVHGGTAVEGEAAAELDRNLWFTFRGLRDKVTAALRVGAPARQIVATVRKLAPIGLDHVTSVYRPDLGSVQLYHLIGGGVIGLEVDPRGVVTAANLLPPRVGQGSVVALEAQDRESPLAWDEPRPTTSVRAALDDVNARDADVVGVRDLDPSGATLEITGRTAGATRRYRYAITGTGGR